MKNMMRFLVLPVVLVQVLAVQQASARISRGEAALLGGVGGFLLGALTNQALNGNDRVIVDNSYQRLYEPEVSLGYREPFIGSGHSGYVEYIGSGSAGNYSDCRITRPYFQDYSGAGSYGQERCHCYDRSARSWIPYDSGSLINRQYALQRPQYYVSRNYPPRGARPLVGNGPRYFNDGYGSNIYDDYRYQYPRYSSINNSYATSQSYLINRRYGPPAGARPLTSNNRYPLQNTQYAQIQQPYPVQTLPYQVQPQPYPQQQYHYPVQPQIVH